MVEKGEVYAACLLNTLASRTHTHTHTLGRMHNSKAGVKAL